MIIRLTNPVTSPQFLRQIPRRQFRAAFTLVELLTAVGIISVLAALLVPAVTKMTKSAKSVRCISNLRQIGIGMNSYAVSNDGQLPIAITVADSVTWVQRIAPYIQNATGTATVWVCPDTRLKPQTVGTDNYLSTYSMHGGLGTENPANRIRKVSVARPGEVILVTDGVQDPGNKNLAPAELYTPGDFYSRSTVNPEGLVSSADGQPGGLSYHHPNKICNALMLDGSVRGLQQGTVKKKNVIASAD